MLLYALRISVVMLITLLPTFSFSATIFSDNFDSHADTCHTGGDVPSGWTMWYENDTYTVKDSVAHYAGEISSLGRNGTGKSLKIWRHSDWPTMNNYSGGLRYDFGSNYSEIYFRYYIKLPTGLTLYADDYLKSWRFNTTGSGAQNEIYLDFRVGGTPGDMRTNGNWGVYDNNEWVTVLDNTGLRAIWDGDWHCIEFQIGLNNSTLKLWVDGILTYSNTSKSWYTQGYFDFIQHFAVGNVADGSTWQNSWQAFEFDDLVISTTYVGPDGTPPPIPPPSPDPTPSPTAGSSGGGGGCFIATAAFGSPMEPGVKILREFRDRILLGNDLGRAFVNFYLKVSPPIADYIGRHDSARILVLLFLLPLVGLCWVTLVIGPFYTLCLGLLLVVLFTKKRAVLSILQK